MVTVIAGPTASGKSSLAIELAKRIDGSIISADSMQIYKGMDIGTAKVDEKDRVVPHYGLDLVDPGTSYSAALFQEYARDAIKKIESAGREAILCGGTGFYIRAVIDDYDFPKGEQDANPFREYYQELLNEIGNVELWKILQNKDPESAALIHPNNSKRVIRALEMLEDGKNYSVQVNNLKNIEQVIPANFIYIDVDKDILNKRINERVDEMRDAGLVDEVEGLLDKGLRSALTSSQAIGYKEIVSALDGEITFDEAFEQIKTATRRYAKRQRSWFRADSRYHKIDGDDGDLQRMLADTLEIIDTFEKPKTA